MLSYNVADLLQSAPGTTLDLEINEPLPPFGPELVTVAPVKGHVRLHRTQRGFLVQGEVATNVQLDCSRCLEPAIQAIKVKFSEEFRVSAADQDDEIEPDAFLVDEHHDLDLTEPLRQYFNLALPLAPLCREDCMGLCPDCGQ